MEQREMWIGFSQSFEKVIRGENYPAGFKTETAMQITPRQKCSWVCSAHERKDCPLSAWRFCPRGFPQKSHRRIEEAPRCAWVFPRKFATREFQIRRGRWEGRRRNPRSQIKANFFLVVAQATTASVKPVLCLNFAWSGIAILERQYLAECIAK